MMQKPVILAATTAVFAVASVALPSNAKARVHHRILHHSIYAFAPWYAPRYRYAAPYRYRYYDRFGSNLNPDRQMVGIGE